MKHSSLLVAIVTLFTLASPVAVSAEDHPLANIPLRNIGPALTSGRVSDFEVHSRHQGFGFGRQRDASGEPEECHHCSPT